MENNKRIVYPDILRILAIFGVINIHVVSQFWTNLPLKSMSWITLVIVDSLFRFSVPIFVMVSGMFMLSPKKERSFKELFSKNILRIAISFIFWTALYSLFSIMSHKFADNYLTPDLSQQLYYFIDRKAHMWFLSMIIGLYLATPILRKIVSDKKTLEYSLIIWFIFVLCSNFLFLLPYIGEPIHNFLNNFKMSVALEYSGYYCLGYYLHNYDLKKKITGIIYSLGILSVLITAFLTVFMSLKADRTFSNFLDYLMPNTMFSSVALFLFVKNIYQNKTFSTRKQSIITNLSKYSFGIYLCHELILQIASFFILKDFISHIFSKYILLLLITTILSFAVSAIINKIPFLNKYIV